jgi:cytochrome c oxidase subunit 2
VPFRSQFDQTLTFEAAFAGAIFLVIVAVFGNALVRYRSGRRSEASQGTEHPKLETSYAVAVLLAAISIVVVTRQAMAADNTPPPGPQTTIQVTGFQWCWQFHYVHPSVTVTASCQDGHYPTLVVPAGRPLHIETTSRDVIHSFWVPAFRFKMDAFPDHVNSFVMTVPHPGIWLGRCAEFCGEDHAFMTFHLRAVAPAAYDRWIAARSGPGPA